MKRDSMFNQRALYAFLVNTHRFLVNTQYRMIYNVSYNGTKGAFAHLHV